MDYAVGGKRDDPDAEVVRLTAGFLLGDIISLKRKIDQGMYNNERGEERQWALFNEWAHGVLVVQKL